MNIPDWEQRFKRALERTDQPHPEGFPEKALQVRELYAKYKTRGLPPDQWNDWEFAGHMSAKLEHYMREPKFDPTGDLRKNYIQGLEQFDVTTGKFPDNVDPQTGRIRE